MTAGSRPPAAVPTREELEAMRALASEIPDRRIVHQDALTLAGHVERLAAAVEALAAERDAALGLLDKLVVTLDDLAERMRVQDVDRVGAYNAALGAAGFARAAADVARALAAAGEGVDAGG